ncbi:MAG TPA: cell envelope integrity protein TolA [Oculatellaceae cyanobacterium]
MAQQDIPKAGDHHAAPPPTAANNGAAQEIQRQQLEAQRRAAAAAQPHMENQMRVAAPPAHIENQMRTAAPPPQQLETQRRMAAPQMLQRQESVDPAAAAAAQRQRAEEFQRQQAALRQKQLELQAQQLEAQKQHPAVQTPVVHGRLATPGEAAVTLPQERQQHYNGTEVRPIVTGQPTGQTVEQHYPNQVHQGHPRPPYTGNQPIYNNVTIVNNNIEPFQGDWHHRHGFDPDRGRGVFAPIILFNPGESWGWRNRQGWDPNCFRPQYDPNYEQWAPSIHQEAGMITDLLNRGDTVNAAQYLNVDLFNMRGDVYAQNELLSEIRQEQSGYGATLFLGNGWDPERGTWNTVEVVSPEPPPGYQPAPSYFLHVYDEPPTDY